MKRFSFLQRLRNKLRISSEANLTISKSAKIVNCDIRIEGKNTKLVIEDGTVIRSSQIEILGDGSTIHIGQNCKIGHRCYLSAKEGKQLTIYEKCMFSRNVKIMTSDGHPIFNKNEIINKAKDIQIKQHVWLADNVTILKGVEIGEGSVVGINSTLTQSIKPNNIAVGNPAKVVKDNIEWEE